MKKIFLLFAIFVAIGAGCVSQPNKDIDTTTSLNDTSAQQNDSEITNQIVEQPAIFELDGTKVVSDDLELEVPDDYYVSVSKDGAVRIQNYDVMLDRMSDGDFFMWLNYEETTPNFAETYATTKLTTYQGYEVLKGDGVGIKSISNDLAVDRGYYFTDSKVQIIIYPENQDGLEAAEALLSIISWK